MKKIGKIVKNYRGTGEKWTKPCSMGVRWVLDDSSMNLRWGFDGVPMGFRSKHGFIEHPSNIHRTSIEQFWECQRNVGGMSVEPLLLRLAHQSTITHDHAAISYAADGYRTSPS